MNDKEFLESLEYEIQNGDDGYNINRLVEEWLMETPELHNMVKNHMEGWKIELAYNLMFGVWTATLTTPTSKSSTSKKDAKELANWIMEQFL